MITSRQVYRSFAFTSSICTRVKRLNIFPAAQKCIPYFFFFTLSSSNFHSLIRAAFLYRKGKQGNCGWVVLLHIRRVANIIASFLRFAAGEIRGVGGYYMTDASKYCATSRWKRKIDELSRRNPSTSGGLFLPVLRRVPLSGVNIINHSLKLIAFQKCLLSMFT